jgi:hypothetical protein
MVCALLHPFPHNGASSNHCSEWPWQIRELNSGKFLVRFPPHKKVADIKNYPSFNLRKGRSLGGSFGMDW